MAGTSKQYELLFMLKAQMDSAFGTGFNSVRTYLSELQGEVKGYNQILRDISAYQKHQQALDTLKTKLEAEKKALADTEQKIAANGKATKALTDEKQKHEKEIARLNTKITDQEKKLDDEKAALEKNEVDVNNLAKAEAELREKVEETTKVMQDFTALKNNVTDLANAFSVMKVGADAAFNAVKAIDTGVVDCINSAGELEYTMSGVEATSGATKAETEQLTEAAKYMGATTSYTASQCAEALQTQALAGWSVSEMLSGLPAVVKLAAASQEDLNTMTGIVSDSLNAFGLSGTESVNRFADVLVKTATSSNTTVSMLGESLSYIESTAANLDYSIEDVSVALAVMANNALKGSVSGSALNTALTRMAGSNKNANDEMERLRLSMFDANETAKPLMTFLNELRDAFRNSGMTAQEMQISAYKLAGQRGMRGLLSIVNTSQEEWEKMTEDIYSAAGAANTMSDIRLDNYRGQMYLLESAADALKTTIGEGFIPMATGAAEALTDMTNGANDFVSAHQEMLVPLSAGITAFGGVAGAIGTAGTALQFAKFALDAFMPGWISLIATTGGIALGIGAVVGIGTALYSYLSTVDETSESVRKLKDETDALVESTGALIDEDNSVIDSLEEERDKANKLFEQLESLSSDEYLVKWNVSEIDDTIQKLKEIDPEIDIEYNAETGTFSNDIGAVKSQFNDRQDNDVLEEKRNKLAALKEQEAALQEQREKAAAYSQKATDEWFAVYSGEKTVDIYNGESMAQYQADYAEALAAVEETESAYEELHSKVQEYEDAIKDIVQAKMDEQEITALSIDQYEEITSLASDYKTAWTEAYMDINEAMKGQFDLLSKANELEKTSLADVKSNLDKKKEQWEQYQQDLQTILSSGIDVSSITDAIGTGTADAMSLARAAAEDVANNGGAALKELADEATSVKGTVDLASGSVADMTWIVADAREALNDALALDDETMRAEAMAAAQNVLVGYADGLSDTSGAKSALSELGTVSISALEEALGEHSPSVYAREAGVNVVVGLNNGGTAMKGSAYSTFFGVGTQAVQGAINGINSKLSALKQAAKAVADTVSGVASAKVQSASYSVNLPGYATGTDYAKAGLAVVGENGPELINFSGGEIVYNNKETQQIMSMSTEQAGRPEATNFGTQQGAVIERKETASQQSEQTPLQLNYAPNITVSGKSDGEGIKAVLQEHSQELVRMVEEILSNRESSMRRRAYG